jgi:hypothetical protein
MFLNRLVIYNWGVANGTSGPEALAAAGFLPNWAVTQQAGQLPVQAKISSSIRVKEMRSACRVYGAFLSRFCNSRQFKVVRIATLR